MKRSKLADALVKGRQPEPETPPETKPGPKRRFHTTLYLDKEFYRRIKIALLNEAEDRDFNRLVNDLLGAWLDENEE